MSDGDLEKRSGFKSPDSKDPYNNGVTRREFMSGALKAVGAVASGLIVGKVAQTAGQAVAETPVGENIRNLVKDQRTKEYELLKTTPENQLYSELVINKEGANARFEKSGEGIFNFLEPGTVITHAKPVEGPNIRPDLYRQKKGRWWLGDTIRKPNGEVKTIDGGFYVFDSQIASSIEPQVKASPQSLSQKP